jgi:protein TonB
MLSLCLLLFIGFTVAGKPDRNRLPISATDWSITPIDPVAIKKDPLPPIPKPLHVAAPAPTIRIVTTRIVPDDQVRPDDKPQPDVVPDNFKIGVTTDLTAHGDDLARPLSDGNGPGSNVVDVPVKTNDDDNIVFRKVEIESEFEGGSGAWQRFLSKNFRVPDAPEGDSSTATVRVQFIVDKEGMVSDVKALDGAAVLQKEAIRVIRLSKKWKPAIQNGRAVNSYKIQPITIRWEN